ncbi:MAG: DUF4115 domain-containing protein [Anaerolineaceae bacterium]|nr:DUF4115 domain-containing protein [Anaerolineaceae bacterium]
MAKTIGEVLKSARLEKNLTLQQVSIQTHIRLRYLEALENGQPDLLPSNVQGRGFLRLYASFLGIPTQPLLEGWESGVIPEPPAETLSVGVPPVDVLPPTAVPVESPVEEPPVTETPRSRRKNSRGNGRVPEPENSAPQEQAAALSPDAPEAPEDEVTLPPEGPQPPSTSDLIFQEIGEQLKQQRLKLGISTTDVEQYTHVRLHYLQALEDGRLDDLPSPVQGRGMLNNYATFLEMNADELLMRFAEGLQERRAERSEAVLTGPTGQPQPQARRRSAPTQAPAWRRLITPDMVIGGAVILLLLGFGIWSAARVSAMRAQDVAATAPSISDVLQNADTATPFVTETVQPQNSPPEEIPDSLSDAVANNNQPEAGSEENLVEGTPSLPSLGDAPLQVYIIASQRAWLHVVTDQKVAFNGRVAPGNAYPFTGNQQIELVTGNAAALQVLYNQNDLGTLGDNGQVVHLIFNASGIITPTPAFSPTPTITQPATLTPLPSPTVPTATITPLIPKK